MEPGRSFRTCSSHPRLTLASSLSAPYKNDKTLLSTPEALDSAVSKPNTLRSANFGKRIALWNWGVKFDEDLVKVTANTRGRWGFLLLKLCEG